MSKLKYGQYSTETPFRFNRELASGKGCALHWHEGVEFVRCVKGEAFYNIDARSLTIKEGDFIVVNSGCMHYMQAKENTVIDCLILQRQFYNENVLNMEQLIFKDKFTEKKASMLFEDIYKVYQDRESPFFYAQARLAILTFLLYMCENHQYTETKESNTARSAEIIYNILNYIEKNHAEKLTLDILSKKTGYSKYHFSRLFKEITGFSLTDHLNNVRCEAARKRLIESKDTITQIYTECGFNNSSHFANIFRNRYGLSPHEYRQKFSKEIET